MPDRDTTLKILDLARWAPSGDNTQPWRFEIGDGERITVRGFDTRDHVLYDFEGHPSQLAHGALLETLRIAATGFGLEAQWELRPGCDDRSPVYDVSLRPAPGLPPDPLLPCIERRAVQRRPMRTTALTVTQRAALAAAPGGNYRVHFFGSLGDRLNMAGLLWANAHIRLTCPEALAVHRDIIEWGARYSKDRIPEQAVGVDPLTAKLMHWAMQSWERVDFLNRYLLGTIPPRVQLDLLPAIACGAHVLLASAKPLKGLEDYVNAGAAMQRFWLTATAQGLHLQPEMTPLIFSWYVCSGKSISTEPAIDRRARALTERLKALIPAEETGDLFFLCRVGQGVAPRSRSTRKDLAELIHQ